MTGFDEQKHTYWLDNKIIPSVTQILSSLSNFGSVDPVLLARKANIGRKVHKCCEWWDKDELDEETLHPTLVEYLEGWKKFRADTRYSPEVWEKWLISKKYRLGGRIDNIGWLSGNYTLVDIKTGVKTISHPLQSAAYQLLWEEETGQKINQRLCVYLKNGKYNIEVHKDKTDRYKFLQELKKYQGGCEDGRPTEDANCNPRGCDNSGGK